MKLKPLVVLLPTDFKDDGERKYLLLPQRERLENEPS
jgi:hypothetical protein